MAGAGHRGAEASFAGAPPTDERLAAAAPSTEPEAPPPGALLSLAFRTRAAAADAAALQAGLAATGERLRGLGIGGLVLHDRTTDRGAGAGSPAAMPRAGGAARFHTRGPATIAPLLRTRAAGLRGRLGRAVLCWLEAVATRIVLRGTHPDAAVQRPGRCRAPEPGMVAPDPPPMTLGHGCPGPRIPVVVPAPAREAVGPADTRLQACVLGEDAHAAALARRLIARGACVHVTAATAEDHARRQADGAVPHRLADLPALAPRLDLVVSTDLTGFVDGRILARLPDRAVIVDLAPLPGSVDFETARRLGRRVTWRPGPPASPGRATEADARAAELWAAEVWAAICPLVETRQPEEAPAA